MLYSSVYKALLVGGSLLGSAVALPQHIPRAEDYECDDSDDVSSSVASSSVFSTTAVATVVAAAPTKSSTILSSSAKASSTKTTASATPSSTKAASSSASTLSTSTALRILALGDSITYGFNESPGNSYRRFLQCSLSTSGYAVTYVGTTTNGDWTNNANDGYVSQEITAIGTSASYILSQTPSPNVVLLHAGSNDILHSVDVASAPDRLGTLIDTVISSTGASVLVAQIIGLGTGYTEYNEALATYNAAIPAIVAARVAQGKNVAVVDMNPVVDADELIDGIHPIASGYKKMAAAWLEGLQGLSVSNVTGAFTDLGASAVPSSGSCADLAA